jgi:hypothetical protein
MLLIRKGSVYTTKQAYFQDKKYRDKTREYVDLANKILPYIKSKLQFGDDVKIVIGFTKGKRNFGYYMTDSKEVRVEIRQICSKFINALVHELVHAQQDFRGQLRQQGLIIYWNDQCFGKHPTSHAKYLALPWEVEARKIAAEMTKEITAMLKEGENNV